MSKNSQMMHESSALRRAGLPAVLLAMVLAGFAPMPAHAATFDVDTPFDGVDSDPGDGVCDSVVAEGCSLRAAIQEANALLGPDTINLPAGTYLLTIAGPFEDEGATGDLDIDDDLTIVGDGSDVTIIDGGSLDRVINVLFPPEPIEGFVGDIVDISGVTITGGEAKEFPAAGGSGGGPGGGGIRNGGQLTLSDVNITSNTADFTFDGGGGIANSGVLVMQDCTPPTAQTTVAAASPTTVQLR